MKLEEARKIALNLVGELSPNCLRAEIAGSIRREKPEVGDIEIVCVPKDDLFGFAVFSILGGLRAIKDGPRYKQIVLPEGINLDLFICLPPAQWGVIFTIRTGPRDFSRLAVTPRDRRGYLPSNCKVADGQVWRNGEPIQTPEEIDFLNVLGLGWIEPRERGVQEIAHG